MTKTTYTPLIPIPWEPSSHMERRILSGFPYTWRYIFSDTWHYINASNKNSTMISHDHYFSTKVFDFGVFQVTKLLWIKKGF